MSKYNGERLIDVISIYPKKDIEFGYFVKADECPELVACPGIEFLPLEESHFVSREDAFGPAPEE